MLDSFIGIKTVHILLCNLLFSSMLMLQSRQDVEKAAELVNEALVIDDKCDFAYETLATLEVQR